MEADCNTGGVTSPATPTALASALVQREWAARIAAEYTSATITQQLVLWMMIVGAPPDLLEDGLAIVRDELRHTQLATTVLAAAGGDGVPALEQTQLGLARSDAGLHTDIAMAVLRFFCLGETVAVPLFSHLRAACTQGCARDALDQILQDEVRHRDFGWDAFDWLSTCTPAAQWLAFVASVLPGLFVDLGQGYSLGNPAIATDAGDLAPSDRAWGLASPREYHAIFERTFDRDWAPRFAARGIDATAAWQHAQAVLRTQAGATGNAATTRSAE